MKIEDLKYFCALCEYLSLSKAAEALYISRNALTRAVDNLEYELDCRLFERCPRGLTLTAAGMEVKHYAVDVVETYEKMVRSVGRLERAQTMRIGMSGFHSDKFALMQCIERFNSQNPANTVKIVSCPSEEIKRSLLDGDLDFYFGIVPRAEEGLDYTPIVNQEFVLLMNREKAPAPGEVLDYERLKSEKLALTNFSDQPQRVLERYMGAKIASNIVYRTTDLTLLYQITASKDVLALLTWYDARFGTVLFPNLVAVSTTPKLHFQMGLVYRRNADMLLSCRKFLDFIKENYKKEYARESI